MADPAVVVAMRAFKRGLLAREAAQMQEMARHWLQVERALAAQIDALAEEIARLRAAGEAPSRAQLYQLEHYRRLLAQVRSELALYASWAGEYIGSGQAEIAGLAIEHGSQAIQLSYDGVGVTFERLPIEAVEAMVGRSGDGTPLQAVLMRRMVEDPAALERLTQTLVDASAQGWNPRKTARRMRDDLTEGLQKALTIARTDQLGVYREVSRMQYQASGVVSGQKRLAAHDDRVCPACIADEGTVYPVSVTIPEHPSGRCTSVPVVDGMPEVRWSSGVDWFRAQPREVQLSIMGPQRLKAWENGLFEFSQMASYQYSGVWGGSVAPTPLGVLVPGAQGLGAGD